MPPFRRWEKQLLGGGLTEPQGWSLAALRRTWNANTDLWAPWWREVSKEAFTHGLECLAFALKNPADGKKAGRTVGSLGSSSGPVGPVPPTPASVATATAAPAASAVAPPTRQPADSRRSRTLWWSKTSTWPAWAAASEVSERGRGFNRAIADAAMAELDRQLAYKTVWYGGPCT